MNFSVLVGIDVCEVVYLALCKVRDVILVVIGVVCGGNTVNVCLLLLVIVQILTLGSSLHNNNTLV